MAKNYKDNKKKEKLTNNELKAVSFEKSDKNGDAPVQRTEISNNSKAERSQEEKEKALNDEKKVKPARNLANLKKKSEKETKLFLVLAFFVPFLIMGVVFARAEVYPFGERQIMFSDCKQQYLPFLKEFQRKLQSGDSMLYSWRNGLGTNFIAMIGYYIASPLNLLTLVIPVEYVREAMAVFTMIKIGCASMFTAIFLKHVYRRNDLSLVAFGCCYAFCDFMMGYYWDIIWLDSVALLPLAALGVYCVVYEKRYKLYIISLALAFLSSYYIGYMICVFIVLWFIVTTIVKKFELVEFCENILKMALYSGIALAMTFPVTLTSYIQLQNTVGTDDAFPDKIEIYNNFMEVASHLFSFNQPTTMEGMPNIATGVFCILLVVIYVRAKDIPLREKIANLSLLGFLFISLNINVLDYIWHGFHFPNLIPYRFAFLFSFVLIAIAYRAFTVFVELEKKDIIGMCIAAMIMVCISVFYLERKAIIGSLIVAGLYIIFMTLYEMDLLNRRLLTVFVSLVIIAEMCVKCSIGVDTVGTTDHNNYPDKEEEVCELVELAEKENPNEFFRIEQTDYSTKNDGMIYGFNGISQFSSTSYKNLINFMSDFGVVSKRSSYLYLLTSPTVPMFMNIKYIVVRDGFTAGDPSMKEYKTSGDGSVVMYENKYYLPIGYISNNKINSVKTYNESVFVTQNKVFKAATGINEDIYTTLTPYFFSCENMTHKIEKGGLYSYSFKSGEKRGKISVTYKAPKDGMLYAWANVKSNNEVKVVSDVLEHSFDVDGHRYVFPLGFYHKGETVELQVDSNKSGTNEIGVAYFNSDIFEKGYKNLADEGLNVTSYTSTEIEGTIDVKQRGTFMTSIPYEKGWTLYVDGKKTETKEALGAFLAADIAQGTHNIKLVYCPEGFVPGIVLALMGLTAFIGLWIFDNVKKKKSAKSR